MKISFDVFYSCAKCDVRDQRVRVRSREDPDEDAADWTNHVLSRAVTKDHRRRSPNCDSDRFDVAIPAQGAWYGGPSIS